NINYRYQLTAIGAYAPLFVKTKIKDRKFVIASCNGAKDAGLEVSWQVTGNRNDAFIRKNPIIVEEEKGTGTASTYKKGEYIHPAAFGAAFGEPRPAGREPRPDGREAFGVTQKTETAAK
ncbi:MAG: hypothetical protein QME51_08410, partial [Planctomycetota bacterium]|nr:hypothetical protein [Planctomycetota bacterium]